MQEGPRDIDIDISPVAVVDDADAPLPHLGTRVKRSCSKLPFIQIVWDSTNIDRAERRIPAGSLPDSAGSPGRIYSSLFMPEILMLLWVRPLKIK